ncbi:MAG: hypothetical protein ACK5M9_13525 [Mycobacterium sp.]
MHRQKAQGDVVSFIRYALDGFLDELRAQIEVVKVENLQIHWESYVYGAFSDLPDTEIRTRQRELTLVMPRERWITAMEATDLNTRLARFYAKAGEHTPTRDLNDLTKLRLAEKDKRRYRVRRSVIQAFIPPTWEAPQTPSFDGLLADLPPIDEGPTVLGYEQPEGRGSVALWVGAEQLSSFCIQGGGGRRVAAMAAGSISSPSPLSVHSAPVAQKCEWRAPSAQGQRGWMRTTSRSLRRQRTRLHRLRRIYPEQTTITELIRHTP